MYLCITYLSDRNISSMRIRTWIYSLCIPGAYNSIWHMEETQERLNEWTNPKLYKTLILNAVLCSYDGRGDFALGRLWQERKKIGLSLENPCW